ncbi:Ankyrin repeat domain-containing protein [Plasmodiophora brassicae]|uniref:Uncharacterized protein n=1 Tax=Plasmodiophora brassicae TaxID=37360 RepID=A0A0G4IXV6_PLABS|nr:hypothetical protein PBRA_007854 [Plasmodiophora brassicae]
MPLAASLLILTVVLPGILDVVRAHPSDEDIAGGSIEATTINNWDDIASYRTVLPEQSFLRLVYSAPGLVRLAQLATTNERQVILEGLRESLLYGYHSIGSWACEKQWDKGQTLLQWASFHGETAIVELLLSAPGINVHVADWTLHRTPLHWASYRGQPAIVKMLLAASGMDVNARDYEHKTPLHLGVENTDAKVVNLLVQDARTDINTVDQDGKTPLQYAIESWRSADAYSGSTRQLRRVIKALIGAGAIDVGTARYTALYWAVDNGLQDIVKLLLQKGVDANHGGPSRSTPLCKAVKKDLHHIVKTLLRHQGTDVNVGNPLLLAVQKGHWAIAEMLVKRVDIDVTSQGVRDAMQLAKLCGHSQLKSLLETGRSAGRRPRKGLFGNPCLSMDCFDPDAHIRPSH